MLPYKGLYEWCEAGRASSSKNLFGFEFFQLWHPGLLWALRGMAAWLHGCMAAWLVESLSTEKVICRMIDTVQKKPKGMPDHIAKTGFVKRFCNIVNIQRAFRT